MSNPYGFHHDAEAYELESTIFQPNVLLEAQEPRFLSFNAPLLRPVRKRLVMPAIDPDEEPGE